MGFFDEKSKKRDRRLSRELADKNIAMQRETNALNKQMNDENNAFNRSLWYEQQEYNSPENQKQRLLAAGMNPYFSGDSAVDAGNTTNAPNMQTATFQAPQDNYADYINSLSAASLNNTNEAIAMANAIPDIAGKLGNVVEQFMSAPARVKSQKLTKDIISEQVGVARSDNKIRQLEAENMPEMLKSQIYNLNMTGYSSEKSAEKILAEIGNIPKQGRLMDKQSTLMEGQITQTAVATLHEFENTYGQYLTNKQTEIFLRYQEKEIRQQLAYMLAQTGNTVAATQLIYKQITGQDLSNKMQNWNLNFQQIKEVGMFLNGLSPEVRNTMMGSYGFGQYLSHADKKWLERYDHNAINIGIDNMRWQSVGLRNAAQGQGINNAINQVTAPAQVIGGYGQAVKPWFDMMFGK